VGEVAIQQLLTETYAEAVRHGAQGWIDDTIALRSPWLFELSAIEVPVLIWHGQDDVFSPVRHARWLADQIRAGREGARVAVMIEQNAAHFDAFEMVPDVLVWAREAGWSEGLGVQDPD
jgi:pimeloyl-ACP methyl ester carboxylesterase